jgi:hypothetical protein
MVYRRESDPRYGGYNVRIENAAVRMEGRKEALTTDRFGKVEFRDLRPGRFVVRVRAEGWVQQVPETAYVAPGRYVELFVRLLPKVTK